MSFDRPSPRFWLWWDAVGMTLQLVITVALTWVMFTSAHQVYDRHAEFGLVVMMLFFTMLMALCSAFAARQALIGVKRLMR